MAASGTRWTLTARRGLFALGALLGLAGSLALPTVLTTTSSHAEGSAAVAGQAPDWPAPAAPTAAPAPEAAPAPPAPASPAAPAAPAPTVAPVAATTGPTIGSGAECGAPGGPPTALIAELVERANAARAASGMGALVWNPQLHCLALDWSVQLGDSGTFDHRDVAAVLGSPAFSAYRGLGENLLRGPAELGPALMHDAWMASPGHRANLLQSQYTSIGIAVYVAPSGQVYVTQNFAL